MASEGRGINNVMIDLIMGEKIEGPNSMYTIKHLYKMVVCLLSRAWPCQAVLTYAYSDLYKFIELFEMVFLSNLRSNILLGTSFTFRVDHHQQML